MSETTDKYARAGLGRRIGFGRSTAFLVVDFNKGCVDPNSPLPPLMNLDAEVRRTRELIDLGRPAGVPVVYVSMGPVREDLKDIGPLGFKVPGLKIFTEGSVWSEIDDRLEVRPEDFLVMKKWQSAFYGTDLVPILVGLGIDTLIVTGCVTSGCVRATVVDACTQGFRVILPRDCVGDRTPELHESNLFDMNAKNADVVESAEVEAYLRGLAASGPARAVA